jgi:capsular polysaccharide biosynthesis protein
MDVPQYKELLDVFNTTNRAIITIEKGERCFVKELYCVPDGQIGPPNYLKIGNVLPEDNKIDLNSLFFLRETLIKHRAERNFPKRIFLSRKNASKRRKYNEDEVYIAIEKYGFEKVLPENYSISEQIALFNGADFIIGTTGAAFSNTLFCNPRCKILCFTNYNIAFSVFSTINCFVKTELIYIYDKTLKYNNKSLLHDDFNVDINELEYFIKTQWML